MSAGELQMGHRERTSGEPAQSDIRSLEANARMWAMLTDISKQLQWPVDGELRWVDKEDWKHIISAGLARHQRVAKGIDGGFVILGQSTRKMKKKDFADMIELMFAFGAQHGIRWSDPTEPPIEAYEGGR